MRTIKFRTWDTQNKEFSEWTNRDPFFSTSHGQIFFWERTQKEDGSYDGDIILDDFGGRFILQQYTGLKDKNGKEIYEGDIIKITEGYDTFWVKVVFENGCFLALWKNPLWHKAAQSEVVGNIFENPELLK